MFTHHLHIIHQPWHHSPAFSLTADLFFKLCPGLILTVFMHVVLAWHLNSNYVSGCFYIWLILADAAWTDLIVLLCYHFKKCVQEVIKVSNVNANIQKLMCNEGNPAIPNINEYFIGSISVTTCSTMVSSIDPYVSSFSPCTQWQSLIESAVITVDLL